MQDIYIRSLDDKLPFRAELLSLKEYEPREYYKGLVSYYNFVYPGIKFEVEVLEQPSNTQNNLSSLFNRLVYTLIRKHIRPLQINKNDKVALTFKIWERSDFTKAFFM
jgi:hypothetical protein